MIDYLRTRHPAEPLPEELLAADDIEQALLQKETLQRLAAALAALDRALRDIIILHYYHGMTLTQIAEQTGRSYGMVKVYHKKALAQLKGAFPEA